jgi:hypothetical protein
MKYRIVKRKFGWVVMCKEFAVKWCASEAEAQRFVKTYSQPSKASTGRPSNVDWTKGEKGWYKGGFGIHYRKRYGDYVVKPNTGVVRRNLATFGTLEEAKAWAESQS